MNTLTNLATGNPSMCVIARLSMQSEIQPSLARRLRILLRCAYDEEQCQNRKPASKEKLK